MTGRRGRAGRSGLNERIAATQLSPTERKVAGFFSAHGGDTVLLSAIEIGRRTRTSDATVIRTAKALGYSGLPELKLELGAELMDTTHPSRRLAMRLSAVGETSLEALVPTMTEEAIDRIRETQRHFDAEALDHAIDTIARAETVHTFGVGLSRVVAEYLAIRLGRTGKRVHFARNMGFSLADDLLQLREGDALVVFNPGRGLREIVALFDAASAARATTILVTGGIGNPSGPVPDITLRASGSPGGLTGEVLTSSMVADQLVLGIAQHDEARATAVSKKLNDLRRAIVGRRID